MTKKQRDSLIKEFKLKEYFKEKKYGNTHIEYKMGSYLIEFNSEEICRDFDLPFYVEIYIDRNEYHKTKTYDIAKAILKEISGLQPDSTEVGNE